MNRITVAVTLVLAVGGQPWAQAATITQTQGFGGTPALHKTVEFDRFNPSHGQLVSVEWQLVLDVQGGAHAVDNDSDSEKSVSVYLGARASLSSNDVKLLDAELAPILHGDHAVTAATHSALNLAIDNGDGIIFDSTGPDAGTHLGHDTSVIGRGIVNPAHLDDYVGTEMFELRVTLDPVADLSDANSVTSQITPVTAWPNVVLVYNYNVVPEPAAIALGLFALLIPSLIGRRGG